MNKITSFLPNCIRELSDKGILKVSGGLLLSDISGFTSMSESLAKEGKKGTEELTHILNDYFGMMLKIIQKYNGDVIKFGGDALLVGFYDNPKEKDVRACASEMMAGMERFKGIKTCAGTFDISMKIVGKSGEWNEFILGNDRRRGHFLCGDTIRETMLLEEHANKGDIIIKNQSASGGLKIKYQNDGVKFKNYKLDSYLPEGVIKLVDKKSFSEHRSVSIIFINLQGYDENNPEVELLQDLFSKVISITEKYDGTINDIIPHSSGNNIMILFGAPISHENDAERAVLASMEISKLNIPPLVLKVGVCTGFVYAGIVGSDWRKEYTVMGDAVNTSERLMETAKAGEAIVSESTYHLTNTKIDYRKLEDIKLKGKEEVLKRFSLIKIREEKYFKFEFVGREKEIKDILKTIEVGGQTILLKGEAGAGKSRLLYEIKNRVASTHKVLEGCMEEIKGPLHIFTSMIARDANIQPDEPEAVRKKNLGKYIKEIDKGELYRRISFIGAMLFGINYPDSMYEKTDAKLRFENLCDALRYYIEYQTKPTIIIFDDIHWITEDDIKVISYITRILFTISKEAGKITFIFAGRPDPDIIDNLPIAKEIEVLKLQLLPLTEESVNQLSLEVLKNKPLPKDIAEIVFKRVGGNPFYLEQFLLDLIEKGLIKEKEGRWAKTIKFKEDDIPENVFSAIMARIDRLTKGAKETLTVGSVIGMEFSEEIIINILKELKVSFYLAETETEHLTHRKMIKEVRYIFSHAMIKAVIYDSILRARRKLLHKAVGEAIERLYGNQIEGFYGILAYHFNNANEWEKALDYNIKVGEKAKKEYHNEEAIRYFLKAAEIVEKELPSKKDALYNAYKVLGHIYSSISSYPIARGYYHNAITAIGTIDKQKVVDALNGVAHTYSEQGNYTGALKIGEEALSTSTKISYREGIAMSLENIGRVHLGQGRYGEALKCCEESLDIHKKTGDKKNIAKGLNNIGIVYFNQGEYKEALKCFEDSLKTKEDIGDKYEIAGSINNIGVVNFHQGQSRYQEALKYYEKALEIHKEMGDKHGRATSLNNMGILNFREGRYAEALKYYEEALKIHKEIGNKFGPVSIFNNVGAIYLNQGQYSEALKFFKDALEICKELGAKKSVAISFNSIGVVYLNQGEYSKALKYFKKSFKIRKNIGDKSGMASSLNNISIIYLNQGEYAEVLNYCEEALKISKEIGDSSNIAKAINNTGLFYWSQGKYAEALTHCEESLKLIKDIGDKSATTSNLNDIGLIYLEQGWYEKTLKYYRESLEIRKEIGDKSGIPVSLNNTGIAYSNKGQYTEALKYSEEALNIFNGTLDKSGIANSLYSMGNSYISIGLFEKGINNLEKTLSIFKEIKVKGNDILGVISSLINGYMEVKNVKSAKKLIEKANKIENKAPQSRAMASLKLSMSRFYEEEEDIAIKHIKETLKIAKDTKQLGTETNAYIRFCELLWKTSPAKSLKQIEEYAEEGLVIAKKMNFTTLLWKLYYWLYKGTGDKKHLTKAKDCLQEQFKYIPSEYLENFKQYVKKYTQGKQVKLVK
ncbi:MAG: tetratricopeptide repeat protein [bacterium]|nr:tetratricopeptide repeat protein [bacterium]